MKLKNISSLRPKQSNTLCGKSDTSYNWYVWMVRPKTQTGKRHRLIHKATALDLVYAINGFDPDEFVRHEIHSANHGCIFVWEESDCPIKFMSFAINGQINFARTVAHKYYKSLPPVGMDLKVMRALFPDPIEMGPRFYFGLKTLSKCKSTNGIDDSKWNALGFRSTISRNPLESRSEHENKSLYVFGC